MKSSESRIFADFADFKSASVHSSVIHCVFSESRIFTDDADWKSVTSSNPLKRGFAFHCFAYGVSIAVMSAGKRVPVIRSKFATLPKML